ncbi:protein fmp52-2, mitochondrial [Aspergillus pseudoustus]|uniref:Protein fmp52-2, mitochondrial n=1 Tax=Aspergillus pseudoustus TaxID=1810923 RepID=A0ABR4KUP2_9EURO
MTTAAIFGSTGGVGSQILATLLASDKISSVKTISRRIPKHDSPKLQAIEEPDITKWAGLIQTLSPQPSVFYNAVGTTRAAAGGIANQWKIDHDSVIESARAAKDAGVKTFVFISSGGTRGFLFQYTPYAKMKVGVEDTVREMGFDQTIILRPGMIIGREVSKAPLLERFFEALGKVSKGLQDTIAADQLVIGRAAVHAARLVEEGKAPSKYWVVEQADIVRLGRDEWREV